ncbi:MAG TPA: glycosyltransferase [Pyrinomonadaceae bacterium]|nr:glycosyltransferase [Pyrinomonadaceae bacterium]
MKSSDHPWFLVVGEHLILTHRPDDTVDDKVMSPFATTVNFSDPMALELLETQLSRTEKAQRFVVGGLLEKLFDPRPLLRLLRRLLRRNPANRLFIASIDASGTGPTSRHGLWTAPEFSRFLTSAGFHLLSTHRSGEHVAVVICELMCTHEQYEQFLIRHGLPPRSSRLVLIASDADNAATTNIERWVSETERLGSQAIVLADGAFHSPAHSWLRVGRFLNLENATERPEAVLEAVLHLVFLYDELDRIEYQDYGGVFFRISQAARANLLPPRISCLAICHGSNFYVERMAQELQPPHRNLTHLWEKVTIELADAVLFPSEYMRQLIIDQLALKPLGEIYVQRLPFSYSPDENAAQLPIDTVVFLGERRRNNGWAQFCNAIQALLTDDPVVARQLARIATIGSNVDGIRLDLPAHVVVEEMADNALDFRQPLRALSARSVVVVAQAGCGQNYLLLQAIDAGCSVVQLVGGGEKELVPDSVRDRTMCSSSALALQEKLAAALRSDSRTRQVETTDTRRLMQAEQSRANHSWMDMRLLPRSLGNATTVAKSSVTVVVPIYNRPFSEIEDVIVGLNNQYLLPAEVIFVDDASQLDFAALYAERIGLLLRVPARFVRHSANKGLSGARNSGLFACRTEFVAVHDSDNIARNNFLYIGCLTLLANPKLDAVTFLYTSFWDGDDWGIYDSRRPRYRPVGDGVVQSLANINWLGDAMAVYRTTPLQELGGWDESDSAMWEDLALFLKLISSKRRIMNVPQYEILYRIRPDSMLRTASEYGARQRLARSVYGLEPFDGLALQRIIVSQRNIDWRREARAQLLAKAQHFVIYKPRLRAIARLVKRAIRHWAAWRSSPRR